MVRTCERPLMQVAYAAPMGLSVNETMSDEDGTNLATSALASSLLGSGHCDG